jgi:hypothetical protein
MVILVQAKSRQIINVGDKVEDPETNRVGSYTGWMPAHPRNPEGLAYVRFTGEDWDESFLPSSIRCKLIPL